MHGVPDIVDVASTLSLKLVGSLSNQLGNLVGAFPCRTELSCYNVLGVLEDSAYNLIPLFSP